MFGYKVTRRPQSAMVRSLFSRWARVGTGAVLVLIICAARPQQAEADVTECFGDPGIGLCPIGSTVCEVASAVTVKDGAILDCGTKDLLVKNGSGKLTVSGGRMTLRAHNLTVETTRIVEAISSPPEAAVVIIELTGSLSLWGQLTARNLGSGSEIRITAAQDIVLEPRDGVGIDIIGSGQSNDGGELVLNAGGDVWIGSKILADGNEGSSSENQNSGGDIDLIAGGGVYINHLVRAYGRWFHGGYMTIRAGGDVEINSDGTTSGRKGEIDLQGRAPEGDGGVLDIGAGGRVLQSGPIWLSGGVGSTGGQAQGGELRVDAGCAGVRLEDSATLEGGMSGGGTLSVESRGDIAVASTISLNARQLGGDGGEVSIRSQMGKVILESASQIYANGNVTSNPTEGVGGTVSLYGCQVDVAGGAVVEATGQANGRFEASSYKQGAELQNSFGIRISENADVSAFSTSGQILLRTPTVLQGYCSGTTTACSYDSDCAVGCSARDCLAGNPQTDGQVTQFSSVPVVQQDASLGPCAATCQ